jgi:hypothetical protein
MIHKIEVLIVDRINWYIDLFKIKHFVSNIFT